MTVRLKKLNLDTLLFWGWSAFLLAGLVIGLYSAVRIFVKGLGITNLTNQVPWGLWITVDLSTIALSGGAFFLSALVYILGIKRFMPAARLAVFIGFLGYSTALFTLLLDIGRPDRFYHALIYWNTHSMLWEVSMCIVLYFSVLTLEVFPLLVTFKLFDKFPRIRKLGHTVHRGAPILAILGLLLSMMHQSSLGGTYGVVAARPIWFRPTMPLMFITSAIAAGPALVVAVSTLVGWIRNEDVVPSQTRFEIAKMTGIVLLIYLYMRFWDLMVGNYGYVPLRNEATQFLLQGNLSTGFWVWEIALGIIVAAFLLIWGAAKKNELALFVGGGLTVMGLVVNRWNTTLIGLVTPLSVTPQITYPLYPTYTPALIEWTVILGVLCGVVLVFTLAMRFLPAFRAQEAHH